MDEWERLWVRYRWGWDVVDEMKPQEMSSKAIQRAHTNAKRLQMASYSGDVGLFTDAELQDMLEAFTCRAGSVLR